MEDVYFQLFRVEKQSYYHETINEYELNHTLSCSTVLESEDTQKPTLVHSFDWTRIGMKIESKRIANCIF